MGIKRITSYPAPNKNEEWYEWAKRIHKALTDESTQRIRDFKRADVDMVDGYHLDQDVRTTASPTFVKITIQDIVTKTPIVDVRYYGAKGDGITDDTTAIQNAINSNKIIYFPPGTYKITSPLSLNSNNYLYGNKKYSKIIVESDIHIISTSLKNNITIENLWFYGNGGAGNASNLYFTDCNDLTIKNCIIENAPNRGINISTSNRVEIINNLLISNGKNKTSDGETIYLGLCTNSLIMGNKIYDTGTHGINFFRSDQTNCSHNIIDTCGHTGITGSGYTGGSAEFCIVEGNTIKNVSRSGIIIENGANYCSISNNTIDGACDYGIIVSDGADGPGPIQCVIIGNTIYNINTPVTGDGTGIRVYGTNTTPSNNAIIVGNTIENTEGYGVQIKYSNYSSITGNSIKSSLNGIRLDDCIGCSVNGNIVYYSDSDGFSIVNCNYCSICGNTSVNNSVNIVDRSGFNLINSNRCVLNGNIAYDNRATKLQAYGINIDNTSDSNRLIGNELSGNNINAWNDLGINTYLENNENVHVYTKTMTTNEWIYPYQGKILILDPNGADRNLRCDSADWTKGALVIVVNTADAAETIYWDAAGINVPIAQNERGIFLYDGSGWIKIYVGS